jgi:hypothetical protein
MGNLSPTKTIDPADYPDEIFPYMGKGYMYEDGQQIPGENVIGAISRFDIKNVKTKNIEYLNKIIALCKERNIDLIFLARPRLAANIIVDGSYGEFHDYVQKLADKNNVPFWDLVYLRPEVLKIEDSMFMDGYHANYTLAFPLSQLVGKMLKEHMAGNFNKQAYLFDTYDEYLRINNRIAAVYAGELSKSKVISANAVTGADVKVEFRFLLSVKKNGEYTVIQDWSTDNQVDLSKERKRKYWLMVEARQTGTVGEAEQRTRKSIDLR